MDRRAQGELHQRRSWFIAGLLGMNVGGIPLAQSEHGFLVILVIVSTFTAVAGWLAFRGRE